MQKSEAIQNHKIKPEESGYYHVMFTKILKDGERTRDEFHVVLYTGREFRVFKNHVDKWGLKATGYNEYEVIHDPTQKKVKEKPAEKKESNSNETDEIRQYLTDKGVEFHPRLGLVKLRELKEQN